MTPMEQILLAIFLAIFLATIFNIIFKRYGISHIIGYILSGTVVSYGLNFNGIDIHSLELIGEFGIVFLMFTIGLELNFSKIKKMKDELLANGLMQVLFSTLLIFLVSFYIFGINFNTSLIVALAFSLSSTAIVLTYLKDSKDIHTPYGQKSLGILIFQDLAVIPILLLITFLSNDTLSLSEVLFKTLLSAIIIVVFMFSIGQKIVKLLLEYSAKTGLEELFLGAVFSIVIGTSLLAHDLGFTYSLGAFIAGVIIADTGYHVKVESDIASYKDLLLGAFFFSVGTKIDAFYFLQNLHLIFAIFLLVVLFKALVIYLILKRGSSTNTAVKTALALSSVGEFSFAIFALALSNNLISSQTASFLILIVVISMILTPFIVNNIYKLSSYFEKEFYESDVIEPIEKSGHTIIVGFNTLGRVVAKSLDKKNIPFVIISDNLKHVKLARKLGFQSYFGHLDKKPVLESLKVEDSSSIIITTHKVHRIRLISEAVLAYHPIAHIIVKLDTSDERKELKDIGISRFIDSDVEVGKLLVSEVQKII
jgi:monovalent cation:H+ antiporter-2, CPA2 family